MKRLTMGVALMLAGIVAYGQATKKYQLPTPQQIAQGQKKESTGDALRAIAKRMIDPAEFIDYTLNLQHVSNAIDLYEHDNGGDWLAAAQKQLGEGGKASKVYVIVPEGAYLYTPSDRSLNLVAEGDFLPKLLENKTDFAKSKILMIGVREPKEFLQNRLIQQDDDLLGKKVEQQPVESPTEQKEEAEIPTHFNPGPHIIIFGASGYDFAEHSILREKKATGTVVLPK